MANAFVSLLLRANYLETGITKEAVFAFFKFGF